VDDLVPVSEKSVARIRSFFKGMLWLVVILLLSFGAVQMERQLGWGETGLGRHPEWSSNGRPHELAEAKQVHHQFCHALSQYQWQDAYRFYADPMQRSVVENYLGVCCVIGYSWRSRKFDEDLVQLLQKYKIPAEGYLSVIQTTSFDSRWNNSSAGRDSMISASDHVLEDPELRKQLLSDLAEWYRNFSGRRRIGYLRMFSNWIGPHDAFIHESGKRAAFQKYTYGKHGKRLGWIEETQYLEMQNHEWKVTEFEVKHLEEPPAGTNQ